jgi:hypothetical protein
VVWLYVSFSLVRASAYGRIYVVLQPGRLKRANKSENECSRFYEKLGIDTQRVALSSEFKGLQLRKEKVDAMRN